MDETWCKVTCQLTGRRAVFLHRSMQRWGKKLLAVNLNAFKQNRKQLVTKSKLKTRDGFVFVCLRGQWTNSLIWLTVLHELGSTASGEELQWDKLCVVWQSSDAPLTSPAQLKLFKMVLEEVEKDKHKKKPREHNNNRAPEKNGQKEWIKKCLISILKCIVYVFHSQHTEIRRESYCNCLIFHLCFFAI